MASIAIFIHLDNLHHNISLLQKQSGNCPLCLAVKANAYGHGALRIVRKAEGLGIRHFGVSNISEAAGLRAGGINSNIILFTIIEENNFPGLWEHNVQPFVSDLEYFNSLVNVWEQIRPDSALKVHIKTDTGMGRIGCPPSELPNLARAVDAHPGFILEGIATHYPLADQPSDSFCLQQAAILQQIRQRLELAGIRPRYYHAENSAGILYHSNNEFNLARPGIAAYGYFPDSSNNKTGLKPVMEMRCSIIFIKKVPAGTSISYGHTWRSKEECWIATINAGYGDGYPRALSNKASVLIHGRSYPQVGTICMDQCMVNLGPGRMPPASRFDEVTLFGPDLMGENAASLALKVGTIPYEITCGISTRVPRVYLESDHE